MLPMYSALLGSRCGFFSMMRLAAVLTSTIILLSPLVQLPPFPAFAQQSGSDRVYLACNTATATSNSTFAQNLNVVADALTRNSSRLLYSFASSQRGRSPSEYVYGMYQCRGDVSLSACSSCVGNVFTDLRSSNRAAFLCGDLARGMRVQFQNCFIRYESNVSYTSVAENGVVLPPSCSGSASSLLYRQNLATALKDSVTAAPQHPLFGFNSTSVGSGSDTAYALTQCLGYLNSSQCAACLSQVPSNYITFCNTSVSGHAYFVDCYYLFSNTSFESASQTPAIASTSRPAGRGRRNHKAAVIGIIVGISALLACIVALLTLCFLRRQKKASDAAICRAEGEQLLPEAGGAKRFSLKELQDATDNFHPSKKLGEGGFGPVYQGRLKVGKEVAIKMLSSQSRQGKSEFVNEVNLITTVQHRNLIQLIGCCVEDNRPLLVYEFLPNRSLDLHLFGASEGIALDWRTRFDIIVGIARGLRYLHEDSPVRIIHRDIKASNILLDNDLSPKIADFGLARLFGEDASHLTTRVVGTLGYLAPEYAISGQLTEKADVYSFGLVTLEIVSGRKVIEGKCEAEKQNLLDWTWALYEKQQQWQIVDEKLHKAGKSLDGNVSMCANVGEVIRVVHVALLCAQLQPQARPTMSEVHDMLCGPSEILKLPSKPMTIGMSSPIADLLHDGSSGMFTSSNKAGWMSQPSAQLPFSYGTNTVSEVEPR